ncbi:hypothetical protein QBC38DRAFT_490976 [Podospora fimiseda]|uniref:Uncharacterized protein n=1 Tax=Podospora fimiseda TaxID=252190 RepID=A0AAN7BDQ9_9PEZI|nr:hypothetical protein QBC38DRAFT_490976 [Podospora fimiseda]
MPPKAPQSSSKVSQTPSKAPIKSSSSSSSNISKPSSSSSNSKPSQTTSKPSSNTTGTKTPWTPKGVSSTNPRDKQNNCIQVTLACLHNCSTVEEFWTFPPLKGIPSECRDQDLEGFDINAQIIGNKIGWLANKVDWRSDPTKTAWVKLLENFAFVPGASYLMSGYNKSNFYCSYLVCPPGGQPWGHAVVGTVYHSPGQPLRFLFRDYQHAEGRDVTGEVMSASEICVIFFNLPQQQNGGNSMQKREEILKELLKRNVKTMGGSGPARPREGAWNDR